MDEKKPEVIFKTTIRGVGSVSYRMPKNDEFSVYELSSENEQYALEYYLLARLSYFKNMHHGYMMNSFWCIEHLLLSILVYQLDKKEGLKEIRGYHSLTNYWSEVKNILGDSQTRQYTQFDSFIGVVMGYWDSRYPSVNEKLEMTTTNKPAPIQLGEDGPKIKHGRVSYIDIDSFDHFFNFLSLTY